MDERNAGDKARSENTGTSIKITGDLLRNPMLIISLSIIGGVNGLSLVADGDSRHQAAIEQLRSTQQVVVDLRQQLTASFARDCAPCGTLIEQNKPLRDQLYGLERDVKDIHWGVIRLRREHNQDEEE